MKPSTSTITFLYLILTLIVVTSVGCGPDFGEKIDVQSTEIYYKDGATKVDAERLGKHLEQMGFIDGKKKSVQLTKSDNVWQFRVSTKGEQAKAAKDSLKLTCLEISAAFDGDEVETHLCDQKLETKSIVKGLSGKQFQFSNNRYFYKDVEVDQVKGFAAIAFGTQLDTSTGFSYHLSKPESVVEIRMAYPKDVKGDERIARAAHDSAVAASNKLFGGKQVDVLICDAFFETQDSYSSTKKAATLTP